MHVICVEDLKNLLLVRFKNERLRQERLWEYFSDGTNRVKTSENNSLIKESTEWLSSLIARRLIRHNGPLIILSSRENESPDLVSLTRFVLKKFEEQEEKKFGPGEKEIFKKFIRTAFGNFFGLLKSMVPYDKSIRDTYWQWINKVLELAEKYDVAPIEFLKHEEAIDEITRQLVPKKQFITLSKKIAKRIRRKFLQIQKANEKFFLIKSESFSISKKGKKFDFKIKEITEKTKTAAIAWLKEETVRVYGINQ